jgi:hypothetical protein
MLLGSKETRETRETFNTYIDEAKSEDYNPADFLEYSSVVSSEKINSGLRPANAAPIGIGVRDGRNSFPMNLARPSSGI